MRDISDTPEALQGAYACDLAAGDGDEPRLVWAAGDWAEEQLFTSRTYNRAGHWELAPGRDERDFMNRLGRARFRLYTARLDGADLGEPQVLAESATVFQDPAVDARNGDSLVVWGQKLAGRFRLRAWAGDGVEDIPGSGGSLTRPAVALDAQGHHWAAWQAFGADGCEIRLSRRDGGRWSEPMVASVPGDSAWRPALAASPGGGVWLAWDAWLGHHFHVFVRRIDAAGGLGEALRLSDLPLLAMDADVAVDPDGDAWVAWEQSPPWGSNHRFNETKTLTLAGVSGSGRAFRPQSPWGNGQAPIPITSFTSSTGPEFIVPVAPRILAGAGGLELYFRRFRSRDVKDFGWTMERIVYAGSDWSAPELVGDFQGMPDTRYGAAFLPDRTTLIAHNATAYTPQNTRERVRDGQPVLRGGSAPVERERIEFVRVGSPESPAPNPPVKVEFKRYEGGRTDYPRVTRDGRSLTLDGQTYQLVWGDLHRHSHLSKCLSPNDGSPIENFRWAVDHNQMDWWALTEHLEYLSYNEWRRVEETVAAFTDYGRFEPLFGFEWGANPGHTNIFYRDQQLGEELRALALMSPSLEDLMERWDARVPDGEVLAARHYQGHRQPDVFEGYRQTWEPCMEVMQSRGEQREWIETFLREGAKIGFIGATDHARHWHFAYCMTGVWVTAPTRDAIFAGIRERRTIAASSKILLHLDVNGVAMGREGEIDGTAQVHVVADSATPLRQIEIYRNGALAHSEQIDSRELDWSWTDRGNPRSESYYYARVTALPALSQGTPAVAYSSPVWVTRTA